MMICTMRDPGVTISGKVEWFGELGSFEQNLLNLHGDNIQKHSNYARTLMVDLLRIRVGNILFYRVTNITRFDSDFIILLFVFEVFDNDDSYLQQRGVTTAFVKI